MSSYAKMCAREHYEQAVRAQLDPEEEAARESAALLGGHSIHCAVLDGLEWCTCEAVRHAVARIRHRPATPKSLRSFVDGCIPEHHVTRVTPGFQHGEVAVVVQLRGEIGYSRWLHMRFGLEEALKEILPVGLHAEVVVVPDERPYHQRMRESFRFFDEPLVERKPGGQR